MTERDLIARLAHCVDPRTVPSIEDELEAFWWFIREARRLHFSAPSEPPENPSVKPV